MLDRMHRARFVVLCLLLAIALGGAPPGGATGPGGPPTGPPATATDPPDSLADGIPDSPAPATTSSAQPLPPATSAAAGSSRILLARMADEMATARTVFRDDLARLTARFERASDRVEALAVQREIAKLKGDLEIAFLEIQARYARAAGLAQRADELDALASEIRGAEGCGPPPPTAPAR